MSDQLLVLEKLVQLLRRGIESDQEALWGFLDVPLARRVALGAHRRQLRDSELQELKARIARRAGSRSWGLSPDQRRAQDALGPTMITPARFREILLGHIDYTEVELAALATIPWSQEELATEADNGWKAILFPGHPAVTPEFLFDIFGSDRRQKPCFDRHELWWLGDDDARELREQKLELRWYLVRRACEPKGAPETDTHRQVSAVEAITAALMLQATIMKSHYFVQPNQANAECLIATAECRERLAFMAGKDEIADYGVGVGLQNNMVTIQRYPGHGAYGPLFTRRLPDGS